MNYLNREKNVGIPHNVISQYGDALSFINSSNKRLRTKHHKILSKLETNYPGIAEVHAKIKTEKDEALAEIRQLRGY